jgi:hypothetical protein
VEHSHAAIIDPEEWEKVQLELARRKTSTRRTQCNSPFSGKLICGDCGEIFGSKVWHSNSKYRRTIWRCNAKYENGDPCSTPHLYEDNLKLYFITALSELLADRTALLEDGQLIRRELLDFSAIDTEIDDILRELDVMAGMIKHLVDENAAQAKSQATYIGQYNSLVERYENLQSRYDTLQQQKERRLLQADAIGGCLFALEEVDLLDITFSEALWNAAVDHVTVYVDDHLEFCFKNGTAITVQMA